MDKLKGVLAKNALIVRQERKLKEQMKQERQLQNRAFLMKKKVDVAARRDAHKTSINRHVGSRLSQYPAAVTKANMSKSTTRMKRVNRYGGNPNPVPEPPRTDVPPGAGPEVTETEVPARAHRSR